MLLFTALFGGLMLLSIESRRRMIAVLLIGCIAILGVSPPPAQAQFCLPCVIQAVLATISQTIGNWLSVINGVVSDIRKLHEQTIWPISAINLAKSQIQSIIARFRGLIQSIMTINPHTATLPNPAALENIIRNRGTGDLGTVPQVYVNAFRPVPQAGAIAPQDRDMTDMDDALAQDNLMLLKVADQAQDLELQAADQIESLVGNPNINVSDYGGSRVRGDQKPGHYAKDDGRDAATGGRTRGTRQRNTQADRYVRRPTAKQHDQRSPAQVRRNRMRDQFNQWRVKAKTGSMHVGRCIRRHTVFAAVALLLTVLISPRKVQGQVPSPCCAILAAGLGTINSTLGSVIGGGLQAINTVLSDISNFEQTVIWPKQAIAQALGMAGQIQGFYAQIRTIFQIPIATATLQNPRQLESILLSRSPGQIPSTTGGYAAVYGVVPTPQNAPPPVRDIIDMTDAVAQDAMERAIAIDAIADQELAAADLMRVRAIDLANNGAHLKLGSAWAVTTQQNVSTTLQHK